MRRRFGCCSVVMIISAVLGFCVLLSVLIEEEPTFAGERVGVVAVKGFITDSTESVEALRRFARDGDVKAVVVQVVSPGGVVAPAQEIHDAVKAVAVKKPVVCSFGSVAASGGYYLAAPATQIVANPGTVTGSIGVILQFQDYQVLLDKIGIRAYPVKSGPLKDAGSPFRSMTEEEKEVMQGVVDDIFQQFVDAVAEGRRMKRESVLALADGRIFSGRQAMELGLVDQLGGFWDAVTVAAELGGIEGEVKIERWKPPRRGVLRQLLGDDFDTALGAVEPLSAPPIRFVLPGW